MTGLTFILVAAAIGFALARFTGLPSIPLLLLVGVGASWLLPIDSDVLQDMLTLGLTVLVFVAGLELNPDRLKERGRAAVTVGVLQFFILGGLGLGAALILGYKLETAAFLALALTASSTLVVVRVLQERQLLFEPIGRLATGILLMQDLLVILFIPVVIFLPDGWRAVGLGIVGTFVLMALAAAVQRWVAPRVPLRIQLDDETLLLLTVSVLFGFMGLAHLLGLPLVSGAFLAGVALSGFPMASLARGQVNSLGEFFRALFFTALGAVLVLPGLGALLQALVFVLLLVVLTPPLVAFLAERAGFSARGALTVGLLIAQASEFSLVVALQGMAVGQISDEVFTIIAMVTVATMVVTPLISRERVVWSLLAIHPFRSRLEVKERPSDHILLIGCGRHGQALLEHLVITRFEVIVLDDDPALVRRLQDAGVPAILGDGADPKVLRRVGADRARIVISTIRRREDNGPLLLMAEGVHVLVRAFSDEDAEWIRRRGGDPVLYSDAALRSFQEWYESESGFQPKEPAA